MPLNQKLSLFKRKYLYIALGSIATLLGSSYLGNAFINKHDTNIIKKFTKKFRENSKSPEDDEYIYLSDFLTDSMNESPDNDIMTSFSLKDDTNATHWQLLRLAQYAKDYKIKNLAIKTLANSNFNEFQYREIAQSCDFDTSVLLARTPNVNTMLFLPPIKTNFIGFTVSGKSPVISPPYFDFDEVITFVLNEAASSNDDCSQCTKYFTDIALKVLSHERSLLKEDPHHVDTEHIYHRHRRSNPSKVYWIYLQALLENSLCGEKQCKNLVNNGLFLVLAALREKFPDIKMQKCIALILANLSVHRELHVHFWTTQWIGVLAQWLQSDNIELSLPASKTLYNLSEGSNSILEDSIYVLHPLHNTTVKSEYDLIFVHGLLGGVFRTWRQCDLEKKSDDYTRCWPQSWLGNDIHNARILAVNYQTYLSDWNVECPSDKYTLKDRSAQLLTNLINGKIGEKPIIWVTHSMGGLIVKQMLTDSRESDDPIAKKILNQTKGIIFYSVPHKGSEMAVWSPRIQRIISPSTEVLELRKDSPILLALHEQFMKVVKDNHINCLSFGESLKSNVGVNPVKWKALLVPQESANPGIGEFHVLPVDHYNTCKPLNKLSPSYCIALNFVKRIIETHEESHKKNKRALFYHLF